MNRCSSSPFRELRATEVVRRLVPPPKCRIKSSCLVDELDIVEVNMETSDLRRVHAVLSGTCAPPEDAAMEAVVLRQEVAGFSGCPLWPRTQVQLIWLISAHLSGSAQRTWFFFRFQPRSQSLMRSCEPE